MNRLSRILLLVAALALVGAATIVVLPGGSVSASAAPGCAATFGADKQSDAWSATEPLQRSFYDASGQATTTTNCFRLKVNKHTDLQDHERMTVRWSGAHVTGGRSLNPYGESGLPQEYPVVMMECRGVDPRDYASGKPPHGAEAVSPSTCWTNTYFQRTNGALPGHGIWEQDAASGDDTDHIQGIDPGKVPAQCNLNAGQDYLVTPFVSARGKFYAGCSGDSMPPEAAAGSVSIPNEVYAFTNLDGSGTFPFEVRTSLENQSLGCSASVKCTLEVIPIDGIDCDNPDPDAACNQTGALPAGQVNNGQAPEDAVAPAFWASASNWDRRVPVPLTFSRPPSVCSIAKAGQPVPFYGSELLDQAAEQWIPAYCLNKSRFNWQDNISPDDSAFQLMQQGGAAAAEVSARGPGDKGIGYAPTAATGWGIAFDIDQANNGPQQTSLKLNALLLAKLLTESYPGSTAVAAEHPGFLHNPLSLNLDPDFIKLNPGLDTTHWSEAASVLMSLSNSSQVMYDLTSYIASDPKAMAFLDGKPEHDGPYTMRVNPAYEKLQLPVDSWPQPDRWKFRDTPNSCLLDEGKNMPPYMPLLANPMTSMQLIAQALLYNWPNVETACSGTGTDQDPYQLLRTAPEGVGNRFILGLVTLGDAQRYGLTTAKLQAAPGHYVAPDSAGIKAALSLAKQSPKLRPFGLTQDAIRRSKRAYPGSMLVYTAAKTYGLPAATAADVAQFIRVSSTHGQEPGRGNGQLAAGYVPIKDSGVTKPMYEQAQAVARAVAAQKAPPTHHSHGHGPGGTPHHNGGVPPVTTPSEAPTGSTPSTGPTAPTAPPSAPPAKTPVSKAPVVTTAATSSSWGGGLLTALLGVGLLAGFVAVGMRTTLWRKGMQWQRP